MALGWPTDPWNNRYLGASTGGDNSAAMGAANNRIGGFSIWPYNGAGRQNAAAATGQINTQDVPSGSGSTDRRVNLQDAPTPTPTAPVSPTAPPVNPFFPGATGSSSTAFRDSVQDPQSGRPYAPTAAQVNANPSGFAGTSWDPSLSAQFRPPTGFANSTTQNTVDSNGETIKGFQPYKAGPGIIDPYAKQTTDRAGNPIDLAANQGNADALLRMYPELQNLGWGGSNRRNMGDWLGDQRTTDWLFSNPAYNLTDTSQRRAVTEAFRSNPLFSTTQDNVTPQNYQQIVAALDAIDPRIAQYWGPRAIYG